MGIKETTGRKGGVLRDVAPCATCGEWYCEHLGRKLLGPDYHRAIASLTSGTVTPETRIGLVGTGGPNPNLLDRGRGLKILADLGFPTAEQREIALRMHWLGG